MMPTVRQIAELAGVSKSTVSLVLNNKPGVSSQTRQAVLGVVEALAVDSMAEASLDVAEVYRADGKARALSLMVLHPPVLRSSYVFSEVLQGIQAAAEVFNAQIRLVMNEPDAGAQHVAHLYLSDDNLRPDGVLVFGARQDEPLIEKAIEQGIPCVVLGRDASQYSISGIGRDETRHANALTAHLIDLGHRIIAFVGGETYYDYTHNRVRGYQQALADAGIHANPDWVSLGAGGRATEHMLDCVPDVTAIIFVNDSYAAEGLAVLDRRGVQIPADVSVASFDDTDIARGHTPPLTSISYNRHKEGQWAVKMLIDQIRYPFIEKFQMIFSADLVVRESTTAPQITLYAP